MPQTTPKYPATGPQRKLLNEMREERGMEPLTDAQLDTLSKGDASQAISALKDMPKAAQGPKPSLMDLAAKITGGEPVTGKVAEAVTGEEDLEADGPLGLTFFWDDLVALRSALSIAICETDGTPLDHELHARIDAFLGGQPKAAPKAPKAGGFPQVPEGRYAVTGEDGTTDFYKVGYGKAGGNWEGFLFLDQQVSDDFVPVKAPPVKSAILAKIAKDPLAAAKRYGTELGVCGVCAKTLTDPKSIADGIGPKCAAKIGG